MFVKDERIPVYEFDHYDEGVLHEQRNVIYIRPRMNFGQEQTYLDALLKSEIHGGATTSEYLLGKSNMALMTLNIVAWEGPAFRDVACTEENILRLDGKEPLVERTLAEINRRNTKQRNDPNDATASTSNGAGNGDSPGDGSGALAHTT